MSDLSEAMALDEQSVTESMLEVLDALLDAMPVLGSPPVAATGIHLQGAIDIVCSTPAHLTVRTEQATGLKLAEGWGLVGEDGPSEVDANDAMSEFTNLVGGSMKFLLSEESSLGLPNVESIDASDDQSNRNWVEIEHPIGHFKVDVGPLET